MTEPGLRIYDNRKDNKSGIYSFEKEASNLDDASESVFRSNQVAWDFFVKQAPSYRKTRIYWIMSAKQEATRISRLNKLIIACEKHIRLF
jgi:uncharacterized protein YdeI (YjbR/CyaY-like superfamily)